MSRGLPTAVPCGVCLVRITGWHEIDDEVWAAVPCGHTEQDILAIGRTMTRVPAATRSAPCPNPAPQP